MSLIDFKRRVRSIKQSIPLRSLLERDGHKLIKNGQLFKMCCPFHREKTPSCVLYPDHHIHCFGCAVHADIFQYVMLRDRCSFKEAVEKLDNGQIVSQTRRPQPMKVVKKEPELPRDYFSNIMTRYWKQTEDAAVGRFAQSVGVSNKSMIALNVGRRDISVWAFPMVNWRENIIGIRYRDTSGKKWAEKGSSQGLFVPLIDTQDDLYVTEGPTDCAALISMGLFAIGKAAAMQGPEEIIKFIRKNLIRRVIVIADNDAAGLKGATKLIDVCPVPCCELVLPAKDAREFYRNGGTREMIEKLVRTCVWRMPKK